MSKNPVTRWTRTAIGVVVSGANDALMAHLRIGSQEAQDALVSDAASSREGTELAALLGQSGKLNKTNLRLGSSLPKDWGTISAAWLRAVAVDVVAQAIIKVGLSQVVDAAEVEAEEQVEAVANP